MTHNAVFVGKADTDFQAERYTFSCNLRIDEVAGQGKTEKGDETIILFLEGGPGEYGKILKLVATIEGVKYVRRNKCTSRVQPTPTIEFPVKGYWTIKTLDDQNDDIDLRET
jgi:hypothetical protein